VLIGGGVLALALGTPMILIYALGLVEISVYVLGLFKMTRLHEIRWARELSIWLTIGAGVVVGELSSMAGRALFPHL